MFEPNFVHLSQLCSDLIIEECVRLGIQKFCIAPGSRSTPLVLSVVENKNIETVVHYDERSLAFFALGWAKALGQPVGIITTSGTAIANLYPAIIEAYFSQIPLFILTADRSTELTQIGHNQTIEQDHFFKYCCDAYHIGSLSAEIPASYILTRLNQLAFNLNTKKQPVHLNIGFRDPLYIKENKSNPELLSYIEPVKTWVTQKTPYKHIELLKKGKSQHILNWLKNKKSLFFLAGDLSSSDAKILLALSKKTGIPIMADACSGLRSHKKTMPISKIKTEELKKFDGGIWVGGRIVCTRFFKDLNNLHIKLLRHHDSPLIEDPYNCCDTYISSAISNLAKIKFPSQSHLLTLKNSISLESSFNQKNLIQNISALLKKKDKVFCSNSLPIRIFDDMCIQKIDAVIPVMANRGASGIDGILSTAAGYAKDDQKHTYLLIGDLAFLHDIGSLTLCKKLNLNLTIIILNNFGGGIFSSLPISENKNYFEEFFYTRHTYSFEQVAKWQDIFYQKITSIKQLKNTLRSSHRLKILECVFPE